MTNGNIKGIFLEIGGSTTGLTDALKDVNKESKNTQKELKEVERALKMNPGNADLLAQKQQLLAQSIQQTRDKLDVLRTAQQQVEAQFQRGDIGAEQYRAFQRELAQTEASLRNYDNQMRSMGSEQTRFNQAQQGMQNYLRATGQSIDDLSSTLGSRLTNAIRNGSASSDQLEMALRRLGQAAGHSGDDLQEFQRLLRNVDGSNNLDEIRRDLDRIGDSADQTESKLSGLAGAIGGLVAGGGLAGTVAAALNDGDIKAIIDVTFDVSEESKASVLEAVRGVQAYGVDAEQALEGVRRQWALNGDASDEANAKVVEFAGVITKSFSAIDFTELIQEANEIGQALNISTEDAMALTNALLKTGFPPEQLDIIAEYGTQLEMAGFNAEEIQAVMAAGVETGTWNIDNLLDGLKEGRIRIAEFGLEVPKALGELLDKTDLSKTQMQEWGKAVASGGEQGTVAMEEIAQWLTTIEDDTLRNALGMQIYGTMWEDQGANITDTLLNMNGHMQTADQNMQSMSDSVSGLDASPMVQMQTAIQNMMTALGPVLEMVAQVVIKIAEWVSNNPQLAATIVAIVTAIGMLVGIIAVLTPIITAVATAFGVGMAAASGIFIGAIAAIIAIVAVVIAVVKNWSTIWSAIQSAMSAFGSWISGAFTATISAFGAFFSAIWTAIVTTATVIWNGLISTLSAIWSGIVSAATTIFNMLVSIVTSIFSGLSAGATAIWNGLKSAITAVVNAIRTVVTTVFNTIKTVVTTIFNGIKSVVITVWNGIKTAITTAVNAVRTVITTVFNAIRTVVTTVFNTIRTITTTVWTAIRTAVTTAVNGIRSVVTSVFNAVRSTVTSVMNAVRSTITNVWNAAKSVVTSAVNGIKSIVTSVFNSLKSVVTNAMNGVKNAIVNGWNAAKSFLQNINLASIGRDIISGLISGISGMVGKVVSAVKNVADKVVSTAKSFFKIKSPSRLMRDQVGYWVGMGIAAGLDKSQSRVAAAMTDLGYILIDEADHYASELVKIDEQLAKDKADALTAQNEAIAKLTETADAKILAIKKKASSKKRKLTKDENNQIAKLNKDLWTAQAKETAKYHATIEKLDDKATKDQFKNLQAESKAYLDTVKSFIDDKKSLEQLSMIEEVAIWKNSVALFEEGSKERIQAQQNYKKAVDAVNKEVESINKAHQDRMQTINDNLKKQTEDLTKAYQDEYDKRVDGFKKSAGDTFTALNIEYDVTGTDLTNILADQVDAMTKFDTMIRQLASRGVADELFNEINEAGVKALPELAAIVAMTDEELSRYSALYEQKHRRAVQLATDQLRPLKTATEQQIKELQNVANRELNVLQVEWIEQIESITKATDGELSSLKQVGIDAGRGLFDGLAQMEDPIVKKAREIAQAVSGTIQKALDIHSPSRVMKGFGVNIGQGLIQGMDDMIRKVAQSSTRLNDAILSAQYSLNNSAQKAQQQKVIERQMVQQATPAIDLDSLVQAIAALAQRPVQTTVNMDGREVAQVVSVHQARQTQLAGLTKGVNMR